ncbi:hypothetical protein ABZ942_35140 [Nocardia sp. NPDC046473]|uniref:hypothetical protein n=1 Tax=Nocardia sp. NPDC046473 TaxID=3155733 RepID=UPI0033E4816E
MSAWSNIADVAARPAAWSLTAIIMLRALYAGLATFIALFHPDRKRREDARAVLHYWTFNRRRLDTTQQDGARLAETTTDGTRW